MSNLIVLASIMNIRVKGGLNLSKCFVTTS